MTPERYREVGRLYREAVELEPGRRAAFLDGACAGDAELRREVESLLEHDARAGDFIAAPAFEVVARAMAAEPAGVGSGGTIGHYRIVSHLGGGGMGEVYLAEDPQLGRRVALKLLPALFAYDPDRMRRFRVEARAANLLDHPNIAAVYSVEEAGGNHFITMEYVEGRPLSDLIPEGGLAVATFFEWLVPLAGALAHAHERGVIHRDLKPANVVVTPDGVPKMLDFGLARLSGAAKGPTGDLLSQTLTAAGTVIGTPAYMSPEQARGDRVDPRSDLFSFGVLMYEALTGRRPFRGESSAAVITQLLDVEPPDAAELRPDAPPLLVRLVGRCLQKDVRHRQQTAAELRAALEAARDSRA